MNKKFSTLVAGAALLLGAVSANAQVGFDGDIKLKEGQSENLYQIQIKGGYLTINETGKLDTVNTVTSKNLARTLWCVTVGKEVQGQQPKFDFLNKGAQAYLDVTMDGLAGAAYAPEVSYPAADTAAVGGEIGGWAYSSVYKNGIELNKPLFSYFTPDSVVGLVIDGSVVKLKKTSADKIATVFTDSVSLVKADAIELNAEEINTVLGSQKATDGVDLTFTPDVKGTDLKNPFKVGKFLAVQATTDGSTADGHFVNVLSKDSSYLYVDTSYTNVIGAAKFLAYKWSDLRYATIGKSAQDSIKDNALASQFKFLFTYYPTNDSLEIQVKDVMFEDATGVFVDTPTDSVYVSLQELVKDQTRILTVDSVAQNTRIGFGYKGCGTITSDKTSKDNGLYVIYNAKGQVLASPIHKNGLAYEWVTLDEQDPEHMPAYQWLVQKTQNSETLKATSPLKITNREFKHNTTVQLRSKDDKITADAFSFTGVSVAAGSVVRFEQITDSTILKDSYLGYRKFDKDSLKVAKYKFNYLHPYAQDKWIKRGEGKDSVLYATDGYTAFTISEGTQVNYGENPANVDGLKGIAKLYRNQYLISLNADTVGVGAENKIVLGQVVLDSVYFKENNHYDSNHYYAIVEASANAIASNKFGVADDGMTANLKSQPLAETRTSAFAIKVDDVPLYRRFNNVALNESATDGADTLRFMETIRKEYLMDENNREGGLMDKNVNYLGIWTADKATGLGFHVDTAWVTRGLGYIKPQYLISVDRTVVPAKGGYICEETTGHITADGTPTDNAEECYHSKPGVAGFVHAKFLVSFADSAAAHGFDKPYTDIKNGYTRVGFVKAIQSGDKLFILVNGFENMKPEDLDTATVAKAYTDAKIYNTYVKSLKNDNHKNYTWSFRYVTPETAANVVKEGPENSFLIESASYEPVAANNRDIAPEKAAWIKMQNGCIVLTDKSSTFSNAKTGGDGALVFNVENKENDELATDNEAIATSEVTVIAQNGAVRIANAEGKKVVITNILGQTIANTVITSSDAVIAAPAGVVVVAVEGEEAVKAIVK
ncbi:hypothetical protein DWW90_11635 [Parabacteroides sp. AF17-28]|uniref:DUF6383 domain-containing protein n=2 Tax=Parabacteroides TaxID=375288 RepID=UPI000EFF5E37|nr:DUF6383 domain-containing protein [Parabacteroides sp. AF17-28]RHR56977.1 hypothetical protein DWW90_11635 [Parabacteroides sp. AF17-28]